MGGQCSMAWTRAFRPSEGVRPRSGRAPGDREPAVPPKPWLQYEPASRESTVGKPSAGAASTSVVFGSTDAPHQSTLRAPSCPAMHAPTTRPSAEGSK